VEILEDRLVPSYLADPYSSLWRALSSPPGNGGTVSRSAAAPSLFADLQTTGAIPFGAPSVVTAGFVFANGVTPPGYTQIVVSNLPPHGERGLSGNGSAPSQGPTEIVGPVLIPDVGPEQSGVPPSRVMTVTIVPTADSGRPPEEVATVPARVVPGSPAPQVVAVGTAPSLDLSISLVRSAQGVGGLSGSVPVSQGTPAGSSFVTWVPVGPERAQSASEQTAGPVAPINAFPLTIPVRTVEWWAGTTSLPQSGSLARFFSASESGLPSAAPNTPGLTQTAAQRKALALGLRLLYPDMTDDEIARAARVSRRTLFRWEEYRRLKIALRKMSKRPRGYKDRDGNLEAWAEDDAADE
jgi:hypothetical protein